MTFVAGKFEYQFPRKPLLWGILNVTPDSFSDGGKYFSVESALARAGEMIREGADILDIGGESSRPGSARVAEAEELRRVIPVIESLAKSVSIPLSIDTMKPAVALAAMKAGASIINDVAANREDDAIWKIAAETGAGYVAMHMKGEPGTMQNAPAYGDVAREVREFFEDRLARLKGAGVPASRVVLDAGIGFGKTAEHNLQLLRGLGSFTTLGRPLLVGVSRKSFIGKVSGDEGGERLGGALACTLFTARHGAAMFRTHDVAATRQALALWEALEKPPY